MSRTLNLSDNVYRKLTRSAAERGLTVEVWLEHMTDAAGRTTAVDRRRGRKVEQLLIKRQNGTATDEESETLDALIEEEYRVAIERAGSPNSQLRSSTRAVIAGAGTSAGRLMDCKSRESHVRDAPRSSG